jgi:hypothetical protein
MREIDLRISDAMKRLADSQYHQRAIDIDSRYGHIEVSPVTFQMMRDGDKAEYFRIYAGWAKEKVRARFETYRDAFKQEGVIPNEGDLSEMTWAFKEVINDLIASLPDELQRWLEQLGDEQIIPDNRREIKILINEMKLEQIEAQSQKSQPASAIYNTTIHGPNYGNFQQGGGGNSQTTNRRDDENKR